MNDTKIEELTYPEDKVNPVKRILGRIFRGRYSHLIYAFILPFVLNYLVYLSMGIHPFGNGSVLVLDLNGQYVYFYKALRYAVFGDSSLLYSFSRALGGEFMGTYAYYVASPFSYIVCLFPESRILEALLFIFLLKAGISGVTMSYYLTKISSKINNITVVMFSLMYSMCAYAIIQQHNSMWIDCLMWLPLLVLGIEELIRNKKYKLFTSMLALCLISNFYIGYMCCIFTAIYFFYYYFSRDDDSRNNPTKERNHFCRSLYRIIGFSAIAAGISMVVVASAYTSLQFGKNTFSNPDFSFSLRFDLIDFMTKFLIGSYDTVRPEGLPVLYCGILTLFCVPLFFISKKFSTREKIHSAILIGILVLSFLINPVDMIWHGFQKPNWLNYRYSFMLCFFLVTLAYKGYGELKKTSGKVIAAIGAFLALFIAVAQKFDYHSYVERISGDVKFDQPLKDLETVWISLLFAVIIGAVLCAIIKSKNKKGLSIVLCIIVSVEIFANAIISCVELGDDVIYSSYTSYHDFIDIMAPKTKELVEYDDSFYRFEKTVHRKYCDNMGLNIRGITNSTSTLNKSTINFLSHIGYSARSHWSKYLGGTPVNDSLIGIKYIIGAEKDYLDDYYTKVEEIEPVDINHVNYYVYENPYVLSLAYAADSSVEKIKTEADSPMLLLNDLVGAINGKETADLFIPLDVSETMSNLEITSRQSTYWTYKPVNSNSDAVLYYTFTTKYEGEVFFYLPSHYAREVRMKVEGKSLGNFYASENTRIFSLGRFPADKEITLSMTLDADVLYVTPNVNQVFQLNIDAVKSEFEDIAGNQMTIDDWNYTEFNGHITTENEDQLIMTSLTYDKGWKIFVDGEEVDNNKLLDALCSFTIETPGEHEIRMVYRPACFTLGLAISLMSLVLFILIIIFEKPLFAAVARIAASGKHDRGKKYSIQSDSGESAAVSAPEDGSDRQQTEKAGETDTASDSDTGNTQDVTDDSGSADKESIIDMYNENEEEKN